MNETLQLIVGVGALIGVYMLTRKLQVWRIKRTYVLILRDLKEKGALAASSAVKLPYAKSGILRMGVRDYRPMALEHLVSNDIVGITEQGAYYVKDRVTADRVTGTNSK